MGDGRPARESVRGSIRPYEARDYDAVSRICLLTAEVGGDASGLFVSDDLMPDVFARPYLIYQPDLAFVVDVGDGAEGYILGVADTRAFVEWFRREWVPRLAERYEHTEPIVTKDDLIRHLGFWPENMLIPEVDEYPAHLHIDLLSHLQGKGIGRELVETLVEALRARGVRGLRLTMDGLNVNARQFYDHVGFHELPSSTAETPALGIRLT
jgi:GNAT superfamily N-acetyltransferase